MSGCEGSDLDGLSARPALGPFLLSTKAAPSKGTALEQAAQANSSAPAGVKVTKVADSCILSQPRSTASLRPALYSAGLPPSRMSTVCLANARPWRQSQINKPVMGLMPL